MRGWPSNVLIRGRNWTLSDERAVTQRDGAFGITMVEDQSVILDNRPLNKQQFLETLVHEFIHVMYSTTPLPLVLGDTEQEKADNEELIVESLAPALLSFIVDNPELVTKIQEEWDKSK